MKARMISDEEISKMSSEELEKWLDNACYKFYCKNCNKVMETSYEVYNQVPDSAICSYCNRILKNIEDVVFAKKVKIEE